LAYTLPEVQGQVPRQSEVPPLKFQGHGGGPPLNKARIDQGKDAASAARGSTFKNNGVHESFNDYLLKQARNKQMQSYFHSILST
jgi:hypothetical protein